MSYQLLGLFGERVKIARRIKGLEQWQLAQSVGIDVGTMKKIEAGTADVSIVQAVELARRLDLSLHDLI